MMSSMMGAPSNYVSIGVGMGVKDRTKEFAAACERAAKTLAAAGGPGGPGGAGSTTPRDVGSTGADGYDPSTSAPLLGMHSANSSHVRDPIVDGARSRTGANSEFAKMASRVGHGIHGTSEKLERLAQLAKRTGAFDDPSREIAELSAVIKQDITALNTAIAELQTRAATQREDGAASRQSAAHAGTIVDTLKGRLMGATKSFKETLTERAESVKQQQARRAMFDGGGGGGQRERVVNPFARADADGGNFPRMDDMNAALGIPSSSSKSSSSGGGNLQSSGAGGLPTYSAGSSSYGMYGDESQQMLMHSSSRQQDSRTEALQNVERTITELGGIFQQLATMVAEQGEMAVRIDENVDDAVMNVDSAQTQLLKYLNRISSNRWLIMKIFGVLIFFLTFFVVFIA